DQDPAGGRQRDEPRHAVAAIGAQGLPGDPGGGRRPGGGDGRLARARPGADGHEPSRAGRVGGHAPPEGRPGHPPRAGDRPDGARHVQRPRQGAGGGVQRLRHQAHRAAAPAGEDRGAPVPRGPRPRSRAM
ncbi:MAG: Circadian input kinase A, partial [uncultured Gemmatimonadetes bacterium]